MRSVAFHVSLLIQHIWRQRSAVCPSGTRDDNNIVYDHIVRLLYSARGIRRSRLYYACSPSGASWLRVVACARNGEVPLLSKMRAAVLERGLLRLISASIADPVVVLLAIVRADKTDWSGSDGLGWSLYGFADAAIISVP